MLTDEYLKPIEELAEQYAGAYNPLAYQGYVAGYCEAIQQQKNNFAKSNVKLCSLCSAEFKPHEQHPNDVICEDCHSKLRGY